MYVYPLIMSIFFSFQIQYVHDGSETTVDNMILEVTLVSDAGYTLPSYLQGRLRFSLYVNVTPVNDPPMLEIPSAKVLRLAQVSCENKLHFSQHNNN